MAHLHHQFIHSPRMMENHVYRAGCSIILEQIRHFQCIKLRGLVMEDPGLFQVTNHNKEPTVSLGGKNAGNGINHATTDPIEEFQVIVGYQDDSQLPDNSINSVQWQGELHKAVDDKQYFLSCCKKFKVEVNRLTAEDMEFDLTGCDASLANAFRRILISEVPTVAIDKVFIANNTLVILPSKKIHW